MPCPIFSPGRTPRLFALVVGLAGSFARLTAGELPLVMDNPGTIEPGKWEIDAGWAFERADGVTAHALPACGVVCGLGPRVDLACGVAWVGTQGSGDDAWALGDSAVTLKWRFYDGGEEHWCASVTPIASFRTPGSSALEKGLSDGGTTAAVMFQLHRCCRAVTYSFEAGFTHATRASDDWAGGAAVSWQVAKTVELGGEARVTTDAHGHGAVLALHAQVAVQLDDANFLLLGLGRDATGPGDAAKATTGYFGWRWYP